MINQFRTIWWFALFLMLAGMPSGWSNCDPDASIDRICTQLHASELKIPAGRGTTNQAQLDTAMLALQVEETRHLYARKLGLQAEGISSDNEVLKARLAYERSQLQQAAKRGLVQKALASIYRQRKVAADISSRYHAQIARRGDLPLQNKQEDIFF